MENRNMKPSNQKGVSLIEIIIASLILIIGIVPLIIMFSNTLESSKDIELESRAVIFAQDMMEEILQGPFVKYQCREGEVYGNHVGRRGVVYYPNPHIANPFSCPIEGCRNMDLSNPSQGRRLLDQEHDRFVCIAWRCKECNYKGLPWTGVCPNPNCKKSNTAVNCNYAGRSWTGTCPNPACAVADSSMKVTASPARAWDEPNKGAGLPGYIKGNKNTWTPISDLGPDGDWERARVQCNCRNPHQIFDRARFDDIDDYNCYNGRPEGEGRGPLHDIEGDPIPNSEGFTREVRVFYVKGDNGTRNDPTDDDYNRQVDERTDFKRIEVRVNWREGRRDRSYILSAICTYYP